MNKKFFKNRILFFVFAGCMFFYACHKNSESNSNLNFQIDANNAPSLFGVNEDLYYGDIKGVHISTSEVPWTDTYWPLVEYGLSQRWGEISAPIPNNEIGLAHFLSAYGTVENSLENSLLLSPAEKHDWALRLLENNNFVLSDLEENIKAINNLELVADATADETVKKAQIQSIQNYLLGNTKNIQQFFPLSMSGWNIWADYAGSPGYKLGADSEGDEWDWMGHCHGWSAAAIMEDKPKHAVMVKMHDKEILFTEGDIRGLLTKAWAEDSPAAYFIGRRCNENTAGDAAGVPADAHGRIFGGVLSQAQLGSDIGFNEIEDSVVYSKAFNGYRTVTKIELGVSEKTYFVVEPNRSGGKYALLPNFSELTQYLNTGNTPSAIAIEAKNFKYFGCRDVNPASLHIILSSYLGKTGKDGKKYRVVMDRIRSGQVWNQPLYKAKLTVDTKLTDILTLTAEQDSRRKYHAGGTRYLANATAKIYWIGEPGSPQMTYPQAYDEQHTHTSTYNYTLEFDENQKIIGGEWGFIGEPEDTKDAPDFIYSFPEGATPTDGIVNYSKIVKPLLKCSLTDNPPLTTTIGGNVIPYSLCSLE